MLFIFLKVLKCILSIFCIADLDTVIQIHYYPSLLQFVVCVFFVFCLDMEQSILFNRRIPFVENFIWV